MKFRSSLACILLLCLAGCADGARLVQNDDSGGVVVYPFKGDQGAVLSSFRKDALTLIKEKCGGPYTIVREGEAKGRARIAGAVEGSQEMVRERRWGIEFRCK
ncbi:conserved exported protein of unknown function [Nitrospira japonica]|uniref:Lipoprotein n=1 Tax=Nitrospira japonica TaxID=1325564 RepID=A0A1W1I3A0_9BACT|nr:hypothetical protein [Nitrospira japonica]SLM47464.1 conserved exported protein of unknown function [Nitrospira japonica]